MKQPRTRTFSFIYMLISVEGGQIIIVRQCGTIPMCIHMQRLYSQRRLVIASAEMNLSSIFVIRNSEKIQVFFLDGTSLTQGGHPGARFRHECTANRVAKTFSL